MIALQNHCSHYRVIEEVVSPVEAPLIQRSRKTYSSRQNGCVLRSLSYPAVWALLGFHPTMDQELSRHRMDQELSPMARKFLKAANEGWEPKIYKPHQGFRKQFYFFYGSLMDSQMLEKVLQLGSRPELRPAKIIGYRCMMWGQYPALVDGEQGEPVHGMAYEVQSLEERQRLEAYETDHYKNVACTIKLQDRNQVTGRTFFWNGETADLTEGRFDLKDWQMKRLDT